MQIHMTAVGRTGLSGVGESVKLGRTHIAPKNRGFSVTNVPLYCSTLTYAARKAFKKPSPATSLKINLPQTRFAHPPEAIRPQANAGLLETSALVKTEGVLE